MYDDAPGPEAQTANDEQSDSKQEPARESRERRISKHRAGRSERIYERHEAQGVKKRTERPEAECEEEVASTREKKVALGKEERGEYRKSLQDGRARALKDWKRAECEDEVDESDVVVEVEQRSLRAEGLKALWFWPRGGEGRGSSEGEDASPVRWNRPKRDESGVYLNGRGWGKRRAFGSTLLRADGLDDYHGTRISARASPAPDFHFLPRQRTFPAVSHPAVQTRKGPLLPFAAIACPDLT